MTEQISTLSAPISAVCCGRRGRGGGSGGELEIMKYSSEAVAQTVEALRYKQEGLGFDSR